MRNPRRNGISAQDLAQAAQSLRELSQQRYPLAMFWIGMWETGGTYFSKDPQHGLTLIQTAAEKDHGPAVYEIGLLRIRGGDLPQDIERGLGQMRRAAVLGSQGDTVQGDTKVDRIANRISRCD